eukprot:3874749-Pleurochrysis_carterae.AAC.3
MGGGVRGYEARPRRQKCRCSSQTGGAKYRGASQQRLSAARSTACVGDKAKEKDRTGAGISKLVSKCQRLSANASACQQMPVLVSKCQCLSANASACQHMPAPVSTCQRLSANASACQHMPALVSTCQRLSAHASACQYCECKQSRSVE